MTSKKSKKQTQEIIEYIRAPQKWLMTTRFKNNTWEENRAFLKKYPNIGCIYPALEPIAKTIPNNEILFVLEMNNDENRIMGIGMLKNRAIYEPGKYRVYSDSNYNRYTYLGKNRIDRTEMTEEEERIMKYFDIVCFTHSNHQKRLKGIKLFPPDIQFRCRKVLNMVSFITNMFKSRKQNPTIQT